MGAPHTHLLGFGRAGTLPSRSQNAPTTPTGCTKEAFLRLQGVDFCNQKICESHKLFLKYFWI